MTAARYRKKPVVIEAIRVREAVHLAGRDFWAMPRWLIDAYEGKNEAGVKTVIFRPEGVDISTLEGVMSAGLDDWIIRGVQGELYPCRDDIFRETYEPEDYDS